MASGIKRVARNWHKLPSGILIPDGEHSNHFRAESYTILSVKDKAVELEDLAKKEGVQVSPTCDLALLIQGAKELSENWLLGRWEHLTKPKLYASAHFNRVAEALLPLAGTSDFKFYLKKLTSGKLDLFARDRSQAKDFLWEAELLCLLRGSSIDAQLKEPPDIVANFEGNQLGIACKKIHSEKNVEKVFSNGVSQIESEFDFGIVAFNIDDLVPENFVISAKNQEEAGKMLNKLNLKFIGHHERHFRKYLSSGRVLSAFVSISALVETLDEEVQINNQRQSTIWMIPGLAPEKNKIFNNLYSRIMQ
jgi:hypothetical protein